MQIELSTPLQDGGTEELRHDTVQSETVDNAISLQQNLGSSAAASYLAHYNIAADTILRVLLLPTNWRRL
jgi:hypothetical protein